MFNHRLTNASKHLTSASCPSPGRILLGLIGLLLLTSCATTRFSHESPCLQVLEPGSRILVPWVPEDNATLYLDGLRRIYKAKDIEITSAHEQEWTLKASGISVPVDSTNNVALQELGFTHLLLIREISHSSGSKYAYYTPLELSRENVISTYKPSWQEQGNRSELLLQLIPLNDPMAMKSLVTETVISPMIFRDDNKGETHVNLTTVESARYKAMMKGGKRIVKKCYRE